MRIETLLLALSLVAVGLTGCVTPSSDAPPPPDGPIPFETLREGQHSGIDERTEVAVRDQEAFKALWEEHTSNQADAPNPPAVNFSEEMVLAVFMGQAGNACHNAEVTNVTGDAERETLVVRGEYYELTGVMCAEVLTSPFHVVRLDAYSGDVVFQMEETERPAGQNGSDDEDREGPVSFETVDQGQDSGIETRQERVITDEATWEDLWRNHTSRHVPTPERPQVDFGERIVLAVFKGESPDGCHGAQIENITRSDGRLTVEGVYMKLEGTACTQQITYPFHIVTVPHTDVDVLFDMQERTRQA